MSALVPAKSTMIKGAASMTLDELTYENKELQRLIIKYENTVHELRRRMQENNDAITKQLDDMNSMPHDCTLCMGECDAKDR